MFSWIVQVGHPCARGWPRKRGVTGLAITHNHEFGLFHGSDPPSFFDVESAPWTKKKPNSMVCNHKFDLFCGADFPSFFDAKKNSVKKLGESALQNKSNP